MSAPSRTLHRPTLLTVFSWTEAHPQVDQNARGKEGHLLTFFSPFSPLSVLHRRLQPRSLCTVTQNKPGLPNPCPKGSWKAFPKTSAYFLKLTLLQLRQPPTPGFTDPVHSGNVSPFCPYPRWKLSPLLGFFSEPAQQGHLST